MVGDPDHELRRQIEAGLTQLAVDLETSAVATVGERLGSDELVAAKVQDAVEAAARYVAEHFSGEIAGMVSGTVARWDGEQTSHRLELLLGPDLQYIRLNGTVVGGTAGLALHTIARTLG
jgi:uncharacterized membrane-anchored protein YjiN (DUF445 family)